MTSTTEYIATADIDRMTRGRLRYALLRARQRIATLVEMLDEEKEKRRQCERLLAETRTQEHSPGE